MVRIGCLMDEAICGDRLTAFRSGPDHRGPTRNVSSYQTDLFRDRPKIGSARSSITACVHAPFALTVAASVCGYPAGVHGGYEVGRIRMYVTAATPVSPSISPHRIMLWTSSMWCRPALRMTFPAISAPLQLRKRLAMKQCDRTRS